MKKNREWLTDIRKTMGLNHREVAKKAGIDRSFYTQIESGIRNPSVKTAKKIASALGFEWTIFFDNDHGDKQQKSAS